MNDFTHYTPEFVRNKTSIAKGVLSSLINQQLKRFLFFKIKLTFWCYLKAYYFQHEHTLYSTKTFPFVWEQNNERFSTRKDNKLLSTNVVCHTAFCSLSINLLNNIIPCICYNNSASWWHHYIQKLSMFKWRFEALLITLLWMFHLV